MEKQEARIKCSGCGSSYKLKIPVTDKPVNFKCKKCGKILKVKVEGAPEETAPAPAAAAMPNGGIESGAIPGLETTQLPDMDDFFDSAPPSAPPPPKPKAAPAPPPPPAAPVAAAAPADPEDPESGDEKDFGDMDFGDLDGPPQFDDDLDNDPTVQIFDPDRMLEQKKVQEQLQAEAAQRLASEAEELKKEKAKRVVEPVIETGYDDQLEPPSEVLDAAAQAREDGAGQGEFPDRRWLVLDEEQVRGPFTDGEITAMIKEREITPETPLRMGQRPWIKAAQISEFRRMFGIEPGARGKKPRLEDSLIMPVQDDAEAEGPTETPFYKQAAALLPWPLGGGKFIPVAIFAGIAFALCAVLSFDFLIGLPLSILGWIFLYGYLANLMSHTKHAPMDPPPAWDFGHAKDMIIMGAKVFLCLLVYSLLPMTVFLLGMIYFFLNDSSLMGWIFMVLTILVYMGSLFIVPASLVLLGASKSLGVALNPGNSISMIKAGGEPYRMLALVSVAAGMVGFLVVLIAVFLVDIPIAGFVIAGLIMAAALSYANFLWFHVLGRFSRENLSLTRRVLASASA